MSLMCVPSMPAKSLPIGIPLKISDAFITTSKLVSVKI
jgi:hypothetical protein